MDKSKVQIREEAAALFRRYGLKSVSMDDVASKLSISKKTLYQYVSSKEELISLVIARHHEEDLAQFSRNREVASDAIDEYLNNSRYFIREMRGISPTFFYDLSKYYSHLWHKDMADHIDYFNKKIAENIRRGQQEELYLASVDPDVITKMHNSTIMTIIDTSLFPGLDISIEHLMRQHALYHLRGIVTESGRMRLREYLETENL